MDEELFKKIKDFTIKEAYLKNEPLNRDTKIYEDLGITGADATEFIIAYGKHFNVDVSEFMAADYFEGEGMNWAITKSRITKKVLTLGDLEKGAIAGKLNENVIRG